MAQVVEPGMNGEWKTDGLRKEVQAILPFLEKLTLQPDDVGPEDVTALRAAGLTDDEKLEAQRDFALRQLSRAESINDLNAFLLSDAAPSGRP